MPSVIPLDKFLGASLLGINISAVIYGITCLQLYLYCTKYSGNDGWAMKFIVAFSWVLDTFHLVLLVIMFYHYAVTNWGDVVVMSRTTWSLDIEVLTGTILTSVIQCFFARRVWLFSGKNWLLTGTIVMLSLAQLGFGNAFMWRGFQEPNFASTGSNRDKLLVGGTFSCVIACDIILTVSMCYYLHKSRTGFKGTETVINILITYAIRTCLLTTIFSLGCLATFFLYPQTMIFGAFYFVACRLYVNSLLSTLNSRERLAEKFRPAGSDFISLSRFAGSGMNTANDGNGETPDKSVSFVVNNQRRGGSEAYSGTEKLPA